MALGCGGCWGCIGIFFEDCTGILCKAPYEAYISIGL